MRPDDDEKGQRSQPHLYFDEDADARLAQALVQRGLDVQTSVEAGLLEASDEEQLEYAVGQQRVLVTHNIRHFPALHTARLTEGGEHWGIAILVGHSAVGLWLRRMEKLLHRFSAETLRNGLFFLGAEFDAPE